MASLEVSWKVLQEESFEQTLQKKELTDDEQLLQDLKNLSPEQIDEVARRLLADPVLADINFASFENLSEYYADKMIAQEIGQTFHIWLRKHTGERIKFMVTPNTTVRQMKEEIREAISAKEEPLMKRKISWKYVWKNYAIMFNNTRLLENDRKLVDYGIFAGDEITFGRYKTT